MALAPQIFDAQVMHKRMFPKVNAFTYRLYYLAAPLSRLSELADGWRFGVNRRGIMSLRQKDHVDPQPILAEWGFSEVTGETIFVVMPRVLGYGFNPVCFWLCLDKAQNLRALIAEVHNTFGEQHSYLAAHPDHRPIQAQDTLAARKLFHVSPFLEREGSYRFRVDYRPEQNRFGIWIDYYDAEERLKLITSLTGKLTTYNPANRRKIFWQIPLLGLRVVGLIHWQALKLVLKGIRYIPKPLQREEKVSASENLTKWSSGGKQTAKKQRV